MTYAIGLATRAGAYCVMTSAMPIEIGRARIIAISETEIVPQSRSTTPKRRVAVSVDQSRENRKLDLSARRAGHAFATRKMPIRTTSAMITMPAPVLSPRKIRSPRRILPLGVPAAGEPAPRTGGASSRVPIAVGSLEPMTDGALVS